MTDPHSVFQFISEGDEAGVRSLLEEYPYALHLRNTDKDAWQEITPIHAAARHGRLEIAKLLVGLGAEVYSNPLASYPAVVIAEWNNRQDVVDYFLLEIPGKAAGTNGLGVALNLAARLNWTDIVRKHIEADPLAVHQRGWIGDTPLHWPSHNGYVEIVELLLDAGAAIEADEINCYGGKPLHWASESEPGTTEVLLGRGAEVDSRNIKSDSDFFGFTPLIMNASQKDDCAEVTELLIAAGADVNAKDARGRTALDLAVEGELTRVPEVLRRHGAVEKK